MLARSAVKEATREVLVFVLGTEEYGVDILKVQEIRGYDKVNAIPGAPPYLKGVMNLRGAIVPVIDLRIKFALPEARYDGFTVVVILRVAGRTIGVVVDGVSDVVQLAPSEIRAAPHLGALVDQSYLAGVAARGDRMVMLMDIERFLSSGEMDLLGDAARAGA